MDYPLIYCRFLIFETMVMFVLQIQRSESPEMGDSFYWLMLPTVTFLSANCLAATLLFISATEYHPYPKEQLRALGYTATVCCIAQRSAEYLFGIEIISKADDSLPISVPAVVCWTIYPVFFILPFMYKKLREFNPPSNAQLHEETIPPKYDTTNVIPIKKIHKKSTKI